MSEALVLKHRPRKFQELVGQTINAVVLDQMVQTSSVPSGLLFSGPSGTGKTTTARILASELESTDTIEVDAASNGGVDEIRKLLDIVRYSSGGAHRVVILDEAQSITRQGYEAFLKTLEEPPAGTIFVLCSTEPHKIPETIQSRLVEFQFRSVSASAILERLRQIAQSENLETDPRLLLHLAQRSEGNVRSAIQSLDMAVRADISSLDEYLRLVGEHDPAPALLAALMTGNHEKIFEVLDEQLSTIASPSQIQTELVKCVRDLFVLKAGGNLRLTGPAFDARKELAARLDSDRLLLTVQLLWEARTKLRNSDDPRGNLELALILISSAFTRGQECPIPDALPVTTPTVEAPAQRRLTLAEMRSK